MGKRVDSPTARKEIDKKKKDIEKAVEKITWEIIDEKMKKAGFKKVRD